MFKFKRIVIDKNRESARGAGLLELSGEEDKKALANYLNTGFIGAKPLPKGTIEEIIALSIKYNNLLFDDPKGSETEENRLYKAFSTAFRIFEIIYSANGNFWIIEGEKGEFAGFFYIYDVISLIYPVKNPPKAKIEYVRKPHTAVLAGCLKKDFWGIESKKIFEKILSMLFVEENFKKIKCEIFSSNPYVKGLLKRFDFVLEGVLKEETINKGVAENVEIWALFEEKWRKNNLKTKPKNPETP